MSPRRALATAAVMAVFPTVAFLVAINGLSDHVCAQFIEKLDTPLEDKKELRIKCNITVQNSNCVTFYWVLFASILINWPLIRWLDDQQWYREWIQKEAND